MDCLPSGIPGDVWAKVDESTMLGTTEPVIGSWGWPGVNDGELMKDDQEDVTESWRQISNNEIKKKVGKCQWRRC